MQSSVFVLLYGIFFLAILGFIAYKIQTGKKWVRTALFIYLIIELLSILIMIFSGMNISFIEFLMILTFGLQVYALTLLYNPESKEWYDNIQQD